MVSLRHETPAPTCAGPGCDEPVPQPAPGRPGRFCSGACRSRADVAREAGGKLMTSVAACPICDTPRPPARIGDQPWCCSIACYRAFHGIDQPRTPSCGDGISASPIGGADGAGAPS